MLEDAQRMMTGRMFDGPLEGRTERVGGEPKPGGTNQICVLYRLDYAYSITMYPY